MQGADVLVYPTAIGWLPSEKASLGAQHFDAWQTIQRSHAIANGCFVAAILVGLIDTMGRSYLDDIFTLVMPTDYAETAAPAVAAMLIYILMAIVLAVRPQGLFPPKSR